VPHANTRLLQYGRTAGIINDLVAEQLRADEGMSVGEDRVLITAGCQEALALCLPTLCSNRSDVLLVCNATYIGAIGAAYASKVKISALPNGAADFAESVDQSVVAMRKAGQNVRAGPELRQPDRVAFWTNRCVLRFLAFVPATVSLF